MLRINDNLSTNEECKNNNKSVFLKGFDNCCIYLHNISTELDSKAKIFLFNREIDEETLEVLRKIITYAGTNTPYLQLNIYCCRPVERKIDLQSIVQDPQLKEIKIYNYPEKDFFHDRFLYILSKEDSIEDIYLMGNSLSAIRKSPMSLAQVAGKCISNLQANTKEQLVKYLNTIKDKSRLIYSKESYVR